MATVITFANQKGGAGKSTVTALLANSLSQDYGKRVLVLDCDLQASLTHLRALQKAQYNTDTFSYDLMQVPLSKLQDTCKKYYEKYDCILVDIPGLLYETDGSAGQIVKFMFICDVVLIPIRASVFDYDSSTSFFKHLSEVQKTKRAMKYEMEIFGFVNQYTKSSENYDLIQNLNYLKFPMLKSKISALADYPRAASNIKSLQKSTVSNPRIKREFNEFTDEIISILNQF